MRAGTQALIVPAILGTAALAIHVIGWGDALRYDRDLIEGGAWYLALTGNLVHVHGSHLGMNLAALGLIAVIVGQAMNPVAWLSAALASAIAVGAGIWLFDPDIARYVGLSGVLHGLFGAGALALWPGDRRLAAILLIALGTKLAWELVIGPMGFSVQAADVAHQAHLYGAVGGLVVGAAGLLLRWQRTPV